MGQQARSTIPMVVRAMGRFVERHASRRTTWSIPMTADHRESLQLRADGYFKHYQKEKEIPVEKLEYLRDAAVGWAELMLQDFQMEEQNAITGNSFNDYWRSFYGPRIDHWKQLATRLESKIQNAPIKPKPKVKK
jgi:hypothetical protein